VPSCSSDEVCDSQGVCQLLDDICPLAKVENPGCKSSCPQGTGPACCFETCPCWINAPTNECAAAKPSIPECVTVAIHGASCDGGPTP
jgi:hypothetical protein